MDKKIQICKFPVKIWRYAMSATAGPFNTTTSIENSVKPSIILVRALASWRSCAALDEVGSSDRTEDLVWNRVGLWSGPMKGADQAVSACRGEHAVPLKIIKPFVINDIRCSQFATAHRQHSLDVGHTVCRQRHHLKGTSYFLSLSFSFDLAAAGVGVRIEITRGIRTEPPATTARLLTAVASTAMTSFISSGLSNITGIKLL